MKSSAVICIALFILLCVSYGFGWVLATERYRSRYYVALVTRTLGIEDGTEVSYDLIEFNPIEVEAENLGFRAHSRSD